MSHQQNHEMNLRNTYPSGAEEWICHTCSRHFILQWEPYKKVVLERGDEYAIHSGGKGGLQLMNPTLSKEEPPQVLSDDLRDALDDFLRGLEEDD